MSVLEIDCTIPFPCSLLYKLHQMCRLLSLTRSRSQSNALLRKSNENDTGQQGKARVARWVVVMNARQRDYVDRLSLMRWPRAERKMWRTKGTCRGGMRIARR